MTETGESPPSIFDETVRGDEVDGTEEGDADDSTVKSDAVDGTVEGDADGDIVESDAVDGTMEIKRCEPIKYCSYASILLVSIVIIYLLIVLVMDSWNPVDWFSWKQNVGQERDLKTEIK
jgi:hypothetical protein